MVHTRNDADRQLTHDSNALRRSYHDSSLAWFALLQPWKLKNGPQFVQRGLFFILPIVSMKRVIILSVALLFPLSVALDWMNSEHEEWFLVSKIDKHTPWCITVATDLSIKLRRCDFDAASKKQLWDRDYFGKIHSALDGSQCIAMMENGRAGLENCETATEFSFNGVVGPIQVDDSYCLTNRGINPNPSDYIHAKKCLDRHDFLWETVPHFQRIMIQGSSSGCLQPRDGDRRRVYLDECDKELAWHFEPQADQGNSEWLDPSFLLHSALDLSLCLRAGRGDTVEDGTWMRLVKCDHDDENQHIVIGPTGKSLHVGNGFDFCIEHRGIKPNVGKDYINVKVCDASNPAKPWSIILTNIDNPVCTRQSVPEFFIDANVNIGDTLFHPGPGFAISCGTDCYRVKDSGDDPPFDPEFGDTLRFAYKEISGRHFSIRSKVCGVGCTKADGYVGLFGRTGLMVRESLDPLSRNIFVSHSPNGQADWSYRSEHGGLTTEGFDGSPDVPCLWITLERNDDDFLYSYAYEGQDACDMDSELLHDLNGSVTIELPDDVFIGLAVSTGVAVTGSYCSYTEAEFHYIECVGCESA